MSCKVIFKKPELQNLSLLIALYFSLDRTLTLKQNIVSQRVNLITVLLPKIFRQPLISVKFNVFSAIEFLRLGNVYLYKFERKRIK